MAAKAKQAKSAAKAAPKPDAKADAGAADAAGGEASAGGEAAAGGGGPEVTQQPAIRKKTLITIGIVLALMWAFAIHVDSLVLEIIFGVITAVIVGLLIYAFRVIKKQQGLVKVLQGATGSVEARRAALAQLDSAKDADAPTHLFARAQLMAQDDPKGALALLDTIELKKFPAAMQDDVSTLKTQLYLAIGRTADARKTAETINLDNPQRKATRTISGVVVAEAFARAGKPKEALALLDTLEPVEKDGEAVEVQKSVVRVFAKFAMNQRQAARAGLVALADADVNNLGRFLMPQFRVHPELQSLARQVLESNPGARAAAKSRARKQR